LNKSGCFAIERSSAVQISLGVAAASCALLLSGCAGVNLATDTTTDTGTVPGVALQGKVHGGQNPISGAKVYLYAVSTSGYGNASTSLLNSPGYVTTKSDGTFSISSDYTCSTGQQVYVYASGGNSGYGTNSAVGLLAGLGACSGLSSSTSIMVNEVSTIATAYALAGFATDATSISSSGRALALTGVANAMATIPNLETLSTGVALATTPVANGGNGTVPQQEINTLANILAACINSNGSTASGAACGTLFSDALSGGTTGTKPSDTATAAINIAHNPWANIAALYGLPTGSPPFAPALTGVPNDWTVGIGYTGTAGAGYWDVAIDASGNIWASNYNEPYSVDEFKPTGAPATGSPFTGGGLDNPDQIAIDSHGYVWVTNPGPDASSMDDTVSELNPSTGKWLSGTSGYGGAGVLDEPVGVAIDQSGYVWVANDGNNSLSELSSTGSQLGQFTGSGQLSSPSGVAIDTSGHIWVGNYGPDDAPAESISEFNSDGSAVSGSPFTGGGLYEPDMIAIDAAGDVWASNNNYYGSPPDAGSICELSSAGKALSPKTYGDTGGGLGWPQGLAIDGAGNVWAANTNSITISELSNTGTAITNSNGYQASGAFTGPIDLAIDGSGNVWVVNGEASGTYSAVITEMVGAATPVVTPIVANLLSPYGSAAVNKP
jgi:hypothetical protein